jgi:hypothetical protein
VKIVALIDVHPLDGSNARGLSMRIASNGQMFDIPISKEQAAVMLSKISTAQAPPPQPPSAEEMSLFASFTDSYDLGEHSEDPGPMMYGEDEDDL